MKLRRKPKQRFRKVKHQSDREQLWRQVHGKCWYCGEATSRKDFRLDHQEPFSRGGADSNRNLVIACSQCDREKGAMTLEEYREFLANRDHGAKVAFYGEAENR